MWEPVDYPMPGQRVKVFDYQSGKYGCAGVVVSCDTFRGAVTVRFDDDEAREVRPRALRVVSR